MAVVHSTGTHLPIEVSKTLAALSALPDGWQVFVGWPDLEISRPDLLVASPMGHLFFISATGAATEELDAFDPRAQVTADSPRVTRRLYRCVESLRNSEGMHFLAAPILVLTSADKEDLEFTFMRRLPPEIRCVNRSDLDRNLVEALAQRMKPNGSMMDAARAHIANPSTIRPQLTVHRHEPTQKLRFLDQLQEDWLRRQLRSPVEAEQLASSAGHYLLTGPAGCGKTLLLLYRAALECKVRPNAAPLVLTHNKPLLADLRLKAKALAEQYGIQQFRTEQVLSWCFSWTRNGSEIVKYRQRDDYIRQAVSPNASAEDVHFHSEEFAYIQDHIIEDFDAYRNFRRSGRSRPLQPEQRAAVWERLQRYLCLLERDHKTDFPTIGLSLLRAVRENKVVPPLTNMILVDEAQFLPPTLLGVLKHAVGREGTLILAADPTQGFLQRRSPWGRADINFVGRATRLRRPYRSTSAILRFAREFYSARSPDAPDVEVNLPNDEELVTSPDGPWPEIIKVERVQDEQRRTAGIVDQLVSAGTLPANILVVPADSLAGKVVLQDLDRSAKGMSKWRVSAATDARHPDQVRVCTLDTVTGLEAPYVILTGLRGLLERESDPMLQNERDQIREDNTRRLYMAFTRAGFRLLLIWSGDRNHPFPITDRVSGKPK